MDYAEARAFLKEKEALGSVYGLSVMKELLLCLGNPEKGLPVVHVAGTNGKGSTIAFAASILRQAGYRVGCYTSPAVFTYEEIIRVDGAFIPKDGVARLIGRIKEAAGEMVRNGFPHPTVFEMETAMAFCYFRETRCQLVFLECGLGGALDATNVVEKPVCVAFTPISRDHMGILGGSLPEIARAKAGILKPGVFAVSAAQEGEVREILKKRANEEGCGLGFCKAVEGAYAPEAEGREGAEEKSTHAPETGSKELDVEEAGSRNGLFSYGKYRNLRLGLSGLYQRENAALALEITDALSKAGYHVAEKDVRAGLLHAEWPGRFQKAAKNPEFYLDGAHNEGAGKKLAESVKFYFTNRRICYIIGVFRDKEYERLLALTAPLAEAVVTVTAPGKRGLDGEMLAESARKWCGDVSFAPGVKEAVRIARRKAGRDGVVVAFGSLSYLGAVALELAGEEDKQEDSDG